VFIAIPSFVSAVGIVLVIVAISLGDNVARQVLLVIGLGLVWFDFFVGMAHQRRALRDIDQRLRAIEDALNVRSSPKS
jgi:hypothetical protein